MSITPFKVNIPDAELDLLKRKLELTRFPDTSLDHIDDNGIKPQSVRELVSFWSNSYDWRAEEREINKLPQYKTVIEVDDGFRDLDIHFVHSPTKAKNAIPLLFIHGWPGSFIEVAKGLPLLNEAGFHVVAPSLPGYGFSSYPRKEGFDIGKHAQVFQKLMIRLGYEKFVVQGGDWGSHITRAMGALYPENVKALHTNMFMLPKSSIPKSNPSYTQSEQKAVDRMNWFFDTNATYSYLQATKPLTLGFAMHDSPVGVLTWIMDKLYLWADNYPWSPTELITWTLLHYFPGPTTGFMMYNENTPVATMVEDSWALKNTKVPTGFSAFPADFGIVPRSCAEKVSNVKFWKEHESGGHFAMHERPKELVGDMVEFFKQYWD